MSSIYIYIYIYIYTLIIMKSVLGVMWEESTIKPKKKNVLFIDVIAYAQICNIAMYCIALYCIALYCIVLYCIVLYCIVLYCITLYCIVLYCIVLYNTLSHKRWVRFLQLNDMSVHSTYTHSKHQSTI
jgi:hypothetical protein